MDKRISDELVGELAVYLDKTSGGVVRLYEKLSHLPEADKPKKKPKKKAKKKPKKKK